MKITKEKLQKTWQKYQMDFGRKRFFFNPFASVVYAATTATGKGCVIKHRAVLDLLQHEFEPIIQKYESSQIDYSTHISCDAPIWVMWWQGMDNAPQVVKRCYRSLVIHTGGGKAIRQEQLHKIYSY